MGWGFRILEGIQHAEALPSSWSQCTFWNLFSKAVLFFNVPLLVIKKKKKKWGKVSSRRHFWAWAKSQHSKPAVGRKNVGSGCGWCVFKKGYQLLKKITFSKWWTLIIREHLFPKLAHIKLRNTITAISIYTLLPILSLKYLIIQSK